MNTVDLYLLCNTPIFAIKVSLRVFHNSKEYSVGKNPKENQCDNQDKSNSQCNEIPCKTRIIHDCPFLVYSCVPIIHDPDVVAEDIHVSLSAPKNEELIVPITNSIIIKLFQFKDEDSRDEDTSLNILHLTQIRSPEDISLILKFIFSGSKEMKPYFDTFKQLGHFSLKRNLELEFKYFLFTFKNNGSLYPPTYYFDYTLKFLEFIRNQQYTENFRNFPFLHKFISVVLNYFRSDGLFGPHTAISFYLYHHFRMPFRCLPFDINPIPKDANYDIEEFKYMNFSFVENIVSLTSPLALLWGYQSICHDYFINSVQHFTLATPFTDHFNTIGLRLRESTGADDEHVRSFLIFARCFFPNKVKSKGLYAHLSDSPISLEFFNRLMKTGTDRFITLPENGESGNFSLPSSMLANALLSDILSENQEGYDFANSSVSSYRASVKQHFANDEPKIASCYDETGPVVTTCNDRTSIYFTSETTHFNTEKVDIDKIDSIEVHPKNPFFIVDKQFRDFVLYQGIRYYQKSVAKMFLLLGTRNISQITIPRTVVRIVESAFENCVSLKSVRFDSDSNSKPLLISIGERAFYGCTKITFFDFSNLTHLKVIGPNAFQCSSIPSVKFDPTVEYELATIDDFAFAYCSKLTEVELPRNCSTLIDIHPYAFFKSAVQKAEISNCGAIYDYAFSMTALNSIQLPTTLNFIGSFAFAKCQLESFKLPPQVTFIQDGILSTNPLKSPVSISDQDYLFFQNQNSNARLFSKFDVPIIMYQKESEEEDNLLDSLVILQKDSKSKIDDQNQKIEIVSEFKNNADHLFDLEISEINFDSFGYEVTSLDPSMFANFFKLQTVDLLDAEIEEISDYCFFNCRSLTSVKLPQTLRRINRFAFAYSGLTEYNWKELINLKFIADFAFYETRLKDFKIPSSVEEIGSHVYSTSFQHDQSTEMEEQQKLNIFQEDSKLKTIVSFAFFRSSISAISLPKSIESIGSYAFAESQITEITIPKTIHRISDGCFRDTPLTNIFFDDLNSIRYIGNYAFAGCLIESFTFPHSITFIGKAAFFNSSLNTVDFSQATNLKFIGKKAFEGTAISEFTLPKNVQKIGIGALFRGSETADIQIMNPIDCITGEIVDNDKKIGDILKDYEMPHNIEPRKPISIIKAPKSTSLTEMARLASLEYADTSDSDFEDDNEDEEEKNEQQEEEEEEAEDVNEED